MDAITLLAKQADAVVQSPEKWKFINVCSNEKSVDRTVRPVAIATDVKNMLLDPNKNKITQFQVGYMSSPIMKQKKKFQYQVIKLISTAFNHKITKSNKKIKT